VHATSCSTLTLRKRKLLLVTFVTAVCHCLSNYFHDQPTPQNNSVNYLQQPPLSTPARITTTWLWFPIRLPYSRPITMAVCCIVCQLSDRSALLVENRKMCIPHLYLAPLQGATPSEFREDIWYNTEWFGHRVVKKLWQHVKPSRHNTGTWRKDRQTDEQKCYINYARQWTDALNTSRCSSNVTTQKKFLKLGKIGPTTLKVVSAPTFNTDTNLAHLTQSVYPE